MLFILIDIRLIQQILRILENPHFFNTTRGIAGQRPRKPSFNSVNIVYNNLVDHYIDPTINLTRIPVSFADNKSVE